MAAFRMRKLTTMPVGLICASVSVHVAKEEESRKQLVKPEQLPIYTAPPLQSKYVEEQPGRLQVGFASIRTTTGRYLGWCKSAYVFMKNGIKDAVQFGKDAYVYLKNPPRDFLPKIGVITVSGLAGFVSARKGSRFKKIAYPLGLATIGATVCYPVQSVIIAKLGNSAKIAIPAKTAQNLKQSVPLPTELSSETKTKSESTSASCTSVTDFDDCPGNITDFCPANSVCACKDGKPFCKCPNFRGQWGNYWYMGVKCDQLWNTLDLILVAALPGIGLALLVGVTIQTIHYCKKRSKKDTNDHREQRSLSGLQPQHNSAHAFHTAMRPQPEQGQVSTEIHL
uniref:MICOS complex subunit n=1 Tax=Sus scrofa TaxID=9823 RepID=A0A4X1W268_PIG